MSKEIPNTTEVSKQSNLKKWLPMFMIALALAIIVIDGTILNVSQKAVINDLQTDLKTIQWAFTSYSLVIAALTIFGGRLGDLYGRLKMFRLGAILFALGSFLTTVAPNVGVLLLGWSVIEGVGAALMTPAASALIVSNYQGRDRGVAFGIFGATAGAASAFGPIIGGLLAKYGTNISSFLSWALQFNSTVSEYFANFGGWRWAFGINVFVVAGLLFGSRIIKDDHVHDGKKINLDLVGVALSGFGLTSIVYGIIESGNYGWWTAKKAFEFLGNKYDLGGISFTAYAILAGVILIISYVLWEFKVEAAGKEPMVRLEIFKNKAFSFGIATLTTLFGGFSGVITYGLIFFFLTVLKFDSLQAGMSLLPFSLTTIVMAPLSAKLSQRFGSKPIIQFGILLNLIGTYMFYINFKVDSTVWTFIPAMIIFGTGFGMVIAQINNVILSSVDPKLAGVASGINGTIREVGRSFGVALIGAAFISTLGSNLKTNLQNNIQISAQAKTGIISSIDIGEVDSGTRDSLTDSQVLGSDGAKQAINGIVAGSQGRQTLAQAQASYLGSYRQQEKLITSEVDKSITEGSKISIVYTGVFILASFILSFGLPTKKKEVAR